MDVVAWTVYTVPSRLERAQELAESIGPDVSVVVQDPADKDRRILNEVDAWEVSLEKDAIWAGVLQDDAIVCQDFLFKTEQRLKEARRLGARVVSFYSPKKADIKAMREGSRWRKQSGKKFLGAVALAMQMPVAAGYCMWSQREFTTDKPWIDVNNAEFFRRVKLDVHVCLPNLVNHDFHIPSTLGHPGRIGGKPRHSRTYSDGAS